MKAAVPLAEILERDWQRQVRQLAETLGYRRAYHTFDSRRSDTGFPDLVLCSPARRRVVFLELKREKGKLTDTQAWWVRDLHRAGAEVYVARPRHFQALAAILGPQGAAAYSDGVAELHAELERLFERGLVA